MDSFLRSLMFSNNVKYPLPLEGTMYDYKFDIDQGKWILWKESVGLYQYNSKLSYSELIIPTKDSICYTYLLNILLLNGKHVVMTGPTGNYITKLD
jgi:dynein heavy chain